MSSMLRPRLASARKRKLILYFARPKVRHLNVATFRQNVGFLSVPPALWRGAATSHFRPREVYVLEGTLVTHKGSFGPGTFVWFPEGEAMEHGASADGDVTVVFITNKSFRIDYVE